MKKTITLLVISTMLAYLPTAAQSRTKTKDAKLCTADIPTTKMGKALRDDVTNSFAQADLDHSGGLSRDELKKTPTKAFPNLKKHFREMDTDRNGEITLQERDAWILKHACKK